LIKRRCRATLTIIDPPSQPAARQKRERREPASHAF
jgi:hypothetical protein